MDMLWLGVKVFGLVSVTPVDVYHWLVDDFKKCPGVKLTRMEIRKDDEQGIVFLYKFIEGISNASYGVKVAELAGIRKAVVDKARKVAAEFSTRIEHIKSNCDTGV